MDFHGFPWNSMDFHGFPWISMEFHGIPWRYLTRASKNRGRPGSKSGLKARAGLWPCWPGDKETGEAAATGSARPGLAAVSRGLS